MGKKFDKIFEAVVSRYQVGGYLPGDIVKFRPSYKSTACYKAMHSIMQKELDELAKSGLNIKVTQVGDKLANQSMANQHKTADQAVITIAGDQGGGRYYGAITVSADMIDIEDASDPTPNIPDQFYRDDDTNFKPVEWKSDAQNITRVTDKGNGKNTPTDLKLAGEGTRLKRDNDNLSALYENTYRSDMITPKERRKISSVFTHVGLDGNGRFETVGKAISAATQVLSDIGFDLDMVSDHKLAQAHHNPGSKDSLLLSYRRTSAGADPFSEEEQIDNSRISFNYTDVGNGFEVVAYAS
tara:strand:+ start:7625 stop:8518 length:894 start_codon:yes stop_codon:yes gene_type:complete